MNNSLRKGILKAFDEVEMICPADLMDKIELQIQLYVGEAVVKYEKPNGSALDFVSEILFKDKK